MNENIYKVFSIGLSITLLLVSFAVFSKISSHSERYHDTRNNRKKIQKELSYSEEDIILSSSSQDKMMIADIFLSSARHMATEQIVKIGDKEISLNAKKPILPLSIKDGDENIDNTKILEYFSNKKNYKLNIKYNENSKIIKAIIE